MTTTTPRPQPQPQPQPQLTPNSHQQLVSTVTDEGEITAGVQPTPTRNANVYSNSSSLATSGSHQYVSPMPSNSNNQLMLSSIASTPLDKAVKLESAEFEQMMKERARMKREKEDSQVAELRVKVSRLEQALAAETKRRVEATRQLEHHAKAEIKHWEDRCKKDLQEQRQIVEGRLEVLELRLNELEDRWKRESQEHLGRVKAKGEEFSAALDELRKEAETERKLRVVRENQFLQQIETHGKDLEGLWDRERQERIECVGELVNQLENNEDAQLMGRKAVEARLEQELAQLQQELEKETLERRKGDDEIHAELERYTLQFQRSLDILHDDTY